MAIEWGRVKFLAVDGNRSIWTYATNQVRADMADLAAQLPRHPRHELIPAKSGIAIIFHSSVGKIEQTINAISDMILAEGKTTKPD